MWLFLLLTADTQFVQGSLIHLRAAPSPTAKIVADVGIATPCTVLGAPKDGFVEVACVKARGFAKAELLAATAPNLSALVQQAQAGSTRDRLTAAGRALALAARGGDDVSELIFDVRQSYKRLFYEAELLRLTEARQKNETLKQTKHVNKECDEAADVCAKKLAAETHPNGLLADWSHVSMRGDDFIYAAVLRDSELYVASGRYETDAVHVELTYKSKADASAIVALSSGEKIEGCYAAAGAAAHPDKGCEYVFDQSCAYDTCWDPFQSCKMKSGDRCVSCARDCTDVCVDCRSKCKDAACLEACGKRAASCGTTCVGASKKETNACDGSYKSCSDKAAKWWKQNCEKNCDAYRKCEPREPCVGKLKPECKDACLFSDQ